MFWFSCHGDVVSNEKTIKWVSEFLWHLEDSSVLNLEAAEAIVNVLKIHQIGERSSELNPFPDAQALVKALENHEYQMLRL